MKKLLLLSLLFFCSKILSAQKRDPLFSNTCKKFCGLKPVKKNQESVNTAPGLFNLNYGLLNLEFGVALENIYTTSLSKTADDADQKMKNEFEIFDELTLTPDNTFYATIKFSIFNR